MTTASGTSASSELSLRIRLALALVIGSALFSGYSFHTVREMPDFTYFWTSSRVLVDVGGPYPARPGVDA